MRFTHTEMSIVEFDNQEPFCYLAGWVAKCCEEVLKLERNY